MKRYRNPGFSENRDLHDHFEIGLGYARPFCKMLLMNFSGSLSGYTSSSRRRILASSASSANLVLSGRKRAGGHYENDA